MARSRDIARDPLPPATVRAELPRLTVVGEIQVEQRTQPQGHFSYRNVAWGMYTALRGRYPRLAAPIRATDPNGPLDLHRR